MFTGRNGAFAVEEKRTPGFEEVLSHPSVMTRDATGEGWRHNGEMYMPVRTRGVVSWCPCEGRGRGARVTLDGWRDELFGTDLETTAWPAAEIVVVVAGDYGRCGQEKTRQVDVHVRIDQAVAAPVVPGLGFASRRIGKPIRAGPEVLPIPALVWTILGHRTVRVVLSKPFEGSQGG